VDFALDASHAIERLILWQPVISGESFLTQFLRMRMASDMLAGKEEKASGTQGMRQAMSAGQSLEIAGYELAPPLAARIDSLNIGNLAVTNTPVHWFEVVSESTRPLPAAAARATAGWQQRGVDLHVHRVTGTAFWASQEITEAPALLSATTGVFMKAPS
jgi:exosortase A-associated hydrolase 2